MTAFENYLIEQGFKRYRQVFEKGNWRLEEIYKGSVSTMWDLAFIYLKGDLKIIFGLGEKGKPPTLQSPRHFTVTWSGEDFIRRRLVNDDEMNRILMKYSPAEVLHAIENKTNLKIERVPYPKELA